MYKLKVDPKHPYHYLISVGVRDMYSPDRGKLFLKHGPVKFTNYDVERVQKAKMLGEDGLFKTSKAQAMKNYEVHNLVSTIWCFLMSATSNNCTVHHFSSDIIIEDDYWENFVELANSNEHERKKLIDAITSSRGFI